MCYALSMYANICIGPLAAAGRARLMAGTSSMGAGGGCSGAGTHLIARMSSAAITHLSSTGHR